MSDAHFFTPAIGEGSFTISGPEGHHAVRVLRLRVGENVTASDGRGRVVRAIVRDSADGLLRCETVEEWSVPPITPTLTVWPAIAKNDKLDLVVQKLTEVGVAVIRPWLSERSIVRWDENKREAHGERWRAIAYAAAKQSRRAWLPQVHDPVDRVEPSEQVVVLHEEAEHPLGAILSDQADLSLVVGPEGGLTENEIEQMTSRGAQVASLGTTVLRAETASIAGAVAVLALKGTYS